jgi:methylmalonyl-CoA mutase N-terminal domain/subunit
MTTQDGIHQRNREAVERAAQGQTQLIMIEVETQADQDGKHKVLGWAAGLTGPQVSELVEMVFLASGVHHQDRPNIQLKWKPWIYTSQKP